MDAELVCVRTVLIYGDCFWGINRTNKTKFAPKASSHFQVQQLILFKIFFKNQG